MRRVSLLVFLFALATPLRPADAAKPWQTLPPTPAPQGLSGRCTAGGSE
jgi:hypothetical protein